MTQELIKYHETLNRLSERIQNIKTKDYMRITLISFFNAEYPELSFLEAKEIVDNWCSI